MKRSHCHNLVFLIILGRSSWKEVILIFYKNFLLEFEPILKREWAFLFALSEAIPKGNYALLFAFFCCLKAEGRSSNLKARRAAPQA